MAGSHLVLVLVREDSAALGQLRPGGYSQNFLMGHPNLHQSPAAGVSCLPLLPRVGGRGGRDSIHTWLNEMSQKEGYGHPECQMHPMTADPTSALRPQPMLDPGLRLPVFWEALASPSQSREGPGNCLVEESALRGLSATDPGTALAWESGVQGWGGTGSRENSCPECSGVLSHLPLRCCHTSPL